MRKYVNTYRTVKEKDGKKHSKAPKIQRLVTPLTLQRKRHRRAIKRERINKVLLCLSGLLSLKLPLLQQLAEIFARLPDLDRLCRQAAHGSPSRHYLNQHLSLSAPPVQCLVG